MKAWIWRWGPAVIVMILIFIASATPGSELPRFGAWDTFVKKGGHMLGYALLGAAYFRALSNGKGMNRFQCVIAVCLAILYAATDELHQKLTPGRTASLQDVGIDSVGACIGVSVLCLIRMRLLRPTKAADS